ncbi:DUF4396 domain-containing protein [Nocardia sp. IFM 10818]
MTPYPPKVLTGDMQNEHLAHGDHASHDHHGHGAPANHEAHANHATGDDHSAHTGPAPATWKMAASATLHCLTGCAIGEILGMVIGTALGWANIPTMVLAIALAFLFGYAFTLRSAFAAGLAFGAAVSVALAADTVSITVMEIVDNAVLWLVPGAMHAGVGDFLFWGSLVFALLVAFVVTTPVNKWMIGRGKGHAVVHSLHTGH